MELRLFVVLLSAIVAILLSTHTVVAAPAAPSANNLPIIFFHGVTSSARAGTNLQRNLSTDSRPFVSLNFCESDCSVRDLPTQVTMAITQIRNLTKTDTRFSRGYVVIGHSQGGILARAVIEEMDDHKAHTFISLAGAQNGNLYGPQVSDQIPTQVFLKALGPKMFPTTLIDFTSYSAADVASGKLQVDFIKLINSQPELQSKLSVANLLRSPVRSDFLRVNKFLPTVNNLHTTATTRKDRDRRKRNFLKLKAAHFFASPADDVISPWQTSILGQYKDVASMEVLSSSFPKLQVIPMKQTHEYTGDTYGLRTLDRRGGLFLHTVAGVGHSCWVGDSTPTGSTEVCKFEPVFSKNLYPLLRPRESSDSPLQNSQARQQ